MNVLRNPVAVAAGLVAALLVGCVDGGPAAQPVASSGEASLATTSPVAEQGQGGGAEAAAPADDEAMQLVAKADPPAKAAPLEGLGDVDLLATIPPPTRPRKRMTIDQLDAALRRVSGGIGWTAGKGTTGKNELETLAITLGKPNYTDLTHEDTEPSALFQKFLGDAATSVCTKLVEAEKGKAASERVYIVGVEPTVGTDTAAAAVEANLRRQLLRFHGRVVETGSPELARWRFLFDGATKITGKPEQGWRAVCVALIQHPAFTTY